MNVSELSIMCLDKTVPDQQTHCDVVVRIISMLLKLSS